MRHYLQRAAALGLVLALTASPVMAQSDSLDSPEAKFAYVAGIYPQGSYHCRVTPRSGGTSETLMAIDFMMDGEGPVQANMVVTGQVNGRRYNAWIGYAGRTRTSASDPEEAVIVLDTVYHFDADPLPGGAEWSDPDGDTITLRIDRYFSMGRQKYILVGTQESEFGVNDLRCLDGSRASLLRQEDTSKEGPKWRE